MPRRVAPISEEKINAAIAIEKTQHLFDGGGLYLLVEPNRSKRWRFKYRFEGKAKMMSFGTHPEVSLNDARSRRDAARALLKKGIDPSVLRKEDKARKRAEELEVARTPSVRVTFDGGIEIWKGNNIMHLSQDEARFIANLLNSIVR